MSSSKLIRKLAFVSSSATVLLGGYFYYKNDPKFFSILMPTLRLIEAETAHKLAVKACQIKIALPFVSYKDPESLVIILNATFK